MGKVYKIVLLSILSLCLGVNSLDYFYLEDSNNEHVYNNNAPNCKLDQGMFLCSDNITCISLNEVCDEEPNCPDESDEDFECNKENDCFNYDCPEMTRCYSLPTSGPNCLCPPGYIFNSSTKSCDDINECEQFGICSQYCVNIKGSYYCHCDQDFKLRKGKCILQQDEPILIYSSDVSVFEFNLKTRNHIQIYSRPGIKMGVSFDGVNYLWVNREMRRIDISPKGIPNAVSTFLSTGLQKPNCLEVDWLTGNVYFTDDEQKYIGVCSNNSRDCTRLVVERRGTINGLALLAQKGLMYWAVVGFNSKILTASMDGFDPKIILNLKMGQITGITVDKWTERLYWIDKKSNTIETIRIDGSDRRVILNSEQYVSSSKDITLFGDNIFWHNKNMRRILVCNKFACKRLSKISLDIYALNRLTIYHQSNHPNIEHACQNSKCSHLCLLTVNNSFTCGCPGGMQLPSSDQFQCVNSDKRELWVIVNNNILKMELSASGWKNITEIHTLQVNIDRFTFNTINGTVIIADNIKKEIKEYDPKERTLNTIVQGNLENITGMAFDDITQNLYWTDADRKVVEVFSYNTKQRIVVHYYSGQEVPLGIGVLPKTLYMLVALQSPKSFYIERRRINDDSAPKIFDNVKGTLSIKFVKDYLTFWIDVNEGIIYTTEPFKFINIPISDESNQISSFSFGSDDVFWTRISSSHIYWNFEENIGTEKRFNFMNLTTFMENGEKMRLMPAHLANTTENPCLENNGGCSHICITDGKHSSSCLCPTDLVLQQDDDRKCVESSNCRFRCKSGKCLDIKRWCNGFPDCEDESDEENCDFFVEQCTLDQHLFLCQDKMTCVELDTVCDGKTNCPDGSDEDGQCFKTDICHESHCPNSSACYPLPTKEKKTCVCPPGYNYDSQKNSCNDIDECKTFGICSNQGCLNTEGSFSCLCDEHFKLDIDNKSCVFKQGDPLLLYTAGKKVAGIFLKTHKKIIIDESPGQKVDVASDEQNIFWINNQTQEVVRALKNGSQQEVLITAELGKSKEIKVDQLTGNIYFIDEKNNKIAVCSKDGKNCMELFSFVGYQHVSNLVLNSKTRYMYWYEIDTYYNYYSKKEIIRPSMDGKNFLPIVTEVNNLKDITLDVHSGWLYWIDGQNRIEAVREDGSDRRTILQLSESSNPSSIAVFEDSVYWTEDFSRTINKANKLNGRNQRVILKESEKPHKGSLQVTYSLNQKNKDNPCKNNKCSHLCLIGPYNEIKCDCPAGMTLSRNKKQCIGSAKKQTLYLASDKSITEIEVTTSGHQRLLKKYKFPMPFDHLTYNPVGNMLYLYDSLSKQILEFNPSTYQTKTLVDRKLGNITGMTLDVEFQNLYWTDSELQTVEIYLLKSQKRAIFHSFPGVDVPIGVGVIEVYEQNLHSSYNKLLVAMQSPSYFYIIKNIGDFDEDIIYKHFENKSFFIFQDNRDEFTYLVDPIHGKVIASRSGKTLFYPVLPHLKEISSIGSTSDYVFWTTSTSSFIYWNYLGNMNTGTKIKIPISSFDFNSKNKIQIIPKKCCSFESSPYESYDTYISVYPEKSSKKLCSTGYVLNKKKDRCLNISKCGFRCDSGKCLTQGERCNGFIDCPENEDEEDCEEYEKSKNNTVCANGRNDMFKCLSGTCIPEKWKCDGEFDCPEGYDESDEICGFDVIVNVDKYKKEVNFFYKK